MKEQTKSKLVIRSRGGYRFEFPLEQDVVTIGRGRECSLILDDTFASRRHARIEMQAGRYVLVDEDSRNGTLVDGKQFKGRHPLSPGDEIQIGDSNLIYTVESAEDTTTKEMRSLSPQQIQSPVQVDVQTWEVWIDGRKLGEKLSVLEFKLMGLLYSHADKVCTRELLCTELWGEDAYTFDMLHQLVHRLKRRIEPDPLNPRYLISVAGVGYRLKTDSMLG